MKTTTKTLIGHIYVDAGLCWVGDPCYVIGEDSSHGTKAWADFVEFLSFDGNYSEPLGQGVGFAISSGFGDGSYPVYIETSNEGLWGERVKRVTIEFIEDEEN